jgi:hypothetical protein
VLGPHPPTQATVTITSEAIRAVATGRIAGEEAITKAIRAARPDVRAIEVDFVTIRWTDPQTRRRVSFDTPTPLRRALLEFSHGTVPRPFRFTLHARDARVTRERPDASVMLFGSRDII